MHSRCQWTCRRHNKTIVSGESGGATKRPSGGAGTEGPRSPGCPRQDSRAKCNCVRGFCPTTLDLLLAPDQFPSETYFFLSFFTFLFFLSFFWLLLPLPIFFCSWLSLAESAVRYLQHTTGFKHIRAEQRRTAWFGKHHNKPTPSPCTSAPP